jgi:hypothetical protein
MKGGAMEQVITQEELFLPLLQFIADHGGEVHRDRDDILDGLADRLGLTQEERNRTTDGGRHQWRSTLEYSRLKLIEKYGAIGTGRRSVWPLTDEGWRLARQPTQEMQDSFAAWQRRRRGYRPASAPPPPLKPVGGFQTRLGQLEEALIRRVVSKLAIARNRALVDALKDEYNYRCQLCKPSRPDAPPIPTGDGKWYVEVHHLAGLAEIAARAEHGEMPETEYQNLTSYHNVIVVCPYHHRLIHHHVPVVRFDRDTLKFVTEKGKTIAEVTLRRDPHLRPK